MLLLSAGFWQLLQAAGAHAGVNVLLVILQGLGLRLTDLCRPWPAWQRCAFMSCICAGCGLLDHHAALGRCKHVEPTGDSNSGSQPYPLQFIADAGRVHHRAQLTISDTTF